MPESPSWFNWSSMGWVSNSVLLNGSMVVARSADIGVEDRAHRAVGEGADLDGPRRRGFEASGAERPHQANDPQAGAEALLGMRSALQDQVTQRGGGGADLSRGAANAC